MSGSSEDERHWIWIILALPLAYLLLLGPAVLYHDSAPRGAQEFIEKVYSPLEALYRRIDGRPFSRYVELWEGLID